MRAMDALSAAGHRASRRRPAIPTSWPIPPSTPRPGGDLRIGCARPSARERAHRDCAPFPGLQGRRAATLPGWSGGQRVEEIIRAPGRRRSCARCIARALLPLLIDNAQTGLGRSDRAGARLTPGWRRRRGCATGSWRDPAGMDRRKRHPRRHRTTRPGQPGPAPPPSACESLRRSHELRAVTTLRRLRAMAETIRPRSRTRRGASA